eukprot:SAG11_NODE_1082_length_5952_cov_2.529301_3_plen_74_part_00
MCHRSITAARRAVGAKALILRILLCERVDFQIRWCGAEEQLHTLVLAEDDLVPLLRCVARKDGGSEICGGEGL